MTTAASPRRRMPSARRTPTCGCPARIGEGADDRRTDPYGRAAPNAPSQIGPIPDVQTGRPHPATSRRAAPRPSDANMRHRPGLIRLGAVPLPKSLTSAGLTGLPWVLPHVHNRAARATYSWGARLHSRTRTGTPLRVVNGSAADATSPIAWTYLPSELASVSVARQRLRTLLPTLPSEQLDDVILATSEVVTNAILHGEGPIRVRAWTGPAAVRVEVSDAGQRNPQPAAGIGNDDEAGRGLFIVDMVTTRWGALPTIPGPGKTVWFEVDVAAG